MCVPHGSLTSTQQVSNISHSSSKRKIFRALAAFGGYGRQTSRQTNRQTERERERGRNWSGVDPPLSLQLRLPHGLHCFLSSSHVLVAIGPLRSPFVSLSLPPWLRFGIWAPGFWALSPGHITLSPGRGVHSGYHVWATCASVVLAGAGLSWPHTIRSMCLQGHGGLRV